MSERTSIIEGRIPVLIVCPHGYEGNDKNTSLITRHMAKSIDAYAVINNGWERSPKVDYLNDKADCNNIEHCHDDVVKEEFLDPIIRFTNKILKGNKYCHIYYIHGMSNKHRDSLNRSFDIVVGYGAGHPNSFSCAVWRKDLFCAIMNNKLGIPTYQGAPGGKMSGWSRNNMNQLFRKKYFEPRIQSMQLEINYNIRDCEEISLLTAGYLASTVIDSLNVPNFKTDTIFNSF